MNRRALWSWKTLALTPAALLAVWWFWPTDEVTQPHSDAGETHGTRPAQGRSRRLAPVSAAVAEASCRHRFSHAVAGDTFVYELRLGAETERLTFHALSVSADPAGAQIRWRADYEVADGARRTGEFMTRCGDEELELRIDAFGAAGAGRSLDLPTFPMRANVAVGTHWCSRERWSNGTWERCFEVIRDGVVENTAAGRFETLEVIRSDSLTIDGQAQEDQSRMWLAEGVGVVRLERAGNYGVTELVAVRPR